MIEFSAPGKAVIWGEYAVLAGAPAMVMAVDRYARVRIDPVGERWSFQARGFTDTCSLSRSALLAGDVADDSAAAPVAAAVRALGISDLPQGAEVELDTRAFYADGDSGRKLGIGSSAAVCTAACAAVADLSGLDLSFPTALSAHRHMQRAEGSGIDVAASFYGGVLRFEAGTATPAVWPETLAYQFVWTGVSAKTTSHLRTFADWRSGSDTGALTALAASCRQLFAATTLENLTDYVRRLQFLDESATLGIYTEPHRILDRLAIERQVVYKPCGAGGGDIGIAFAEDAGALNAFAEAAARLAFHPLKLEMAAHGTRPTR